jgi:hypothetical protein
LDVIEGFVPPATRSKKAGEDEDEPKRNHKREEK